MRYLSLFSGIGGFELALQEVCPSATCLGFSEVDDRVAALYREHFPDHAALGDVSKIDFRRFRGEVDLIVGGPPCTELSGIRPACPDGRALGLSGEHSGLFAEFVRAIEECEPRHILMENVASMAGRNRDAMTARLRAALPNVRDPVLLNAAHISAQKRRRLFWATFDVEPLQGQGPRFCDILVPATDRSHFTPISEKQEAFMAATSGLRKKVPRWEESFHADTAVPKTPTLLAALSKGAPFNVVVDRRFDPPLHRRYDIAECEALQGFPRGWTKGLCMTRALKAVGNAVHVGVAAHALQHLATATDTQT